jgi:hypothetical protein
MKSFRIFPAVVLIVSFIFSPSAFAVIDNNAPIVKLRDPAIGGCVEAGVTLNNCFSDIGSLNSWTWGTRKPTSTSPLVVEIGPGIFGQFYCGDAVSNIAGFISFRGAGMDKTTLASVSIFGQCANAAFDHMTVGGTGVNYAVTVVNGGTNTTWTNVKLTGPTLWQEYCVGGSGGKHYWFGSQLVATLGGSYQVACDQSWFFGSEITSKGPLTFGDVIPLKVSGSELHVYGSVIRALGNGSGAPSDLYTVTAVSATGGQAHIHGTGIDVIAVNGAPAAVTALAASNGAMIHANVSSYNLSTGAGGTITRISNNGGHVHAPYLWEEHQTPPDIASVTGSDMAVVTDGTQPHLLIYSSNCASKWFDTSTNACRP